MVEIRKLTDAEVRASNTPGKYFDGAGLVLAVTPRRSGGVSKCWLVRFTAPDGRSREMGLGSYPEVSLAQARAAAERCRFAARNGVDPLTAKDEARKARRLERARSVTFACCGDRYVTLHEPTWKNEKHRYQWRATLRDYVYPIMGKTPVNEVDSDLVVCVLEPIWTTKRETAVRVRARIETILNWAAAQGYRDRNAQNPAAWRGHLQFILPKRKSRRLVRHLPALPYRDIPAFMGKLREAQGLGARALELTILCAGRTSETRFARWREFNLEHAVWTIPGERMKAGVEHRVPLSDPVLQILRNLKSEIPPEHWDPDAFVFRGPSEEKPMSDAGMRAVLHRMGLTDITVHGFRSTFRDWGAECTNYPPEVVKMALAHAIDDEVDAAYRRGELFEKRALLMTEWAAYCGRAPERGEPRQSHEGVSARALHAHAA